MIPLGKGLVLTGKKGNRLYKGIPSGSKYFKSQFNKEKIATYEKGYGGRGFDEQGNVIFEIGVYDGSLYNEDYNSHIKPDRFDCIKYDDGYYVGETYWGVPEGIGIYLWYKGGAYIGDWHNGEKQVENRPNRYTIINEKGIIIEDQMDMTISYYDANGKRAKTKFRSWFESKHQHIEVAPDTNQGLTNGRNVYYYDYDSNSLINHFMDYSIFLAKKD